MRAVSADLSCRVRTMERLLPCIHMDAPASPAPIYHFDPDSMGTSTDQTCSSRSAPPSAGTANTDRRNPETQRMFFRHSWLSPCIQLRNPDASKLFSCGSRADSCIVKLDDKAARSLSRLKTHTQYYQIHLKCMTDDPV